MADQVALIVDDYIALIKQSLALLNTLVYAKAGQELMPPAIFPSMYFDDLKRLKGDKSILYANKENLQTVSLPNAERDIDTHLDLVNRHNNQ